MAYASTAVPHSTLRGAFSHRETKAHFEFQNFDPDNGYDWLADASSNFPHEVFVGGAFGDETRRARVLKTVAYIVVDEDECGNPVVEKWDIKEDWTR